MESMTVQVSGKDDKISRIIDKVLRQVFGGEATYLIYRYLEKNYRLKRGEIGERIEVFAAGLEEFLSSGAFVVERKILEDIYSDYGLLRRVELKRVQDESNFVNQVKSLMRKA